MNKLMLCASLAGLMLSGAATSALADDNPGVQIGTLTCHEASGWGVIIGSSRHLRCDFEGASGVEHYTGNITRIGVDVGYQGASRLVWAVFAPSSDMHSGALSGSYGGVTASAAVGVGAGANALVGGLDRSVTLQPLSVEGKTGLEVAAGIGGMTLHHDRDEG
jgi:uncharacterized protein DUF992